MWPWPPGARNGPAGRPAEVVARHGAGPTFPGRSEMLSVLSPSSVLSLSVIESVKSVALGRLACGFSESKDSVWIWQIRYNIRSRLNGRSMLHLRSVVARLYVCRHRDCVLWKLSFGPEWIPIHVSVLLNMTLFEENQLLEAVPVSECEARCVYRHDTINAFIYNNLN